MISKKVIRNDNQKRIFCVGCTEEISSGFYYTGSVLAGKAHMTRKSYETLPIQIVSLTQNEAVLSGGQSIEHVKRIGFVKYNKGPICLTCGANYHTVEIGNQRYPIVKTDPDQKFIGSHSLENSDKKGYSFLKGTWRPYGKDNF